MNLTLNSFKKKIFSLEIGSFEEYALWLFRYQAQHNPVYGRYLHLLKTRPNEVKNITDIPFLPIDLFKRHCIKTGKRKTECIFSSSGTTGQQTSRHEVADIGLYEKSFENAFRIFYGDMEQYVVLALLPAYLERGGSSLVYMADKWIAASRREQSGFYLYDYDRLAHTLEALEQQEQKTLLLGVSFALWDFAEQYAMPLRHTLLMETGGMKGKRPEIVREELHGILCRAFDTEAIHSEYGMTELLSQCYSQGKGLFRCPPWVRVFAHDLYDPFAQVAFGQTGCLKVIDLANVYSCAFVATADLGKCYADGTFEVLGRADNSDVRGCNLMF